MNSANSSILLYELSIYLNLKTTHAYDRNIEWVSFHVRQLNRLYIERIKIVICIFARHSSNKKTSNIARFNRHENINFIYLKTVSADSHKMILHW